MWCSRCGNGRSNFRQTGSSATHVAEPVSAWKCRIPNGLRRGGWKFRHRVWEATRNVMSGSRLNRRCRRSWFLLLQQIADFGEELLVLGQGDIGAVAHHPCQEFFHEQEQGHGDDE